MRTLPQCIDRSSSRHKPTNRITAILSMLLIAILTATEHHLHMIYDWPSFVPWFFVWWYFFCLTISLCIVIALSAQVYKTDRITSILAAPRIAMDRVKLSAGAWHQQATSGNHQDSYDPKQRPDWIGPRSRDTTHEKRWTAKTPSLPTDTPRPSRWLPLVHTVPTLSV